MSDDWGNDPLKPMVGTVSKDEFKSILNKTFGVGRWTPTSDYRTPAQEDALRRQGAGTVARGRKSAHSEGTPDDPGAFDFQVPGMSQAEAASKLQAADKRFTKVFAEKAQGGQGEHVHAATGLTIPDTEGWGNDPLTPDPTAKATTPPAPKKVAPGYVRGGPDVGVHETPAGPLAQADADMRSYAHPYLQDMRKIAARNRGNALASPLDVASGLGDAFQVIASPFAAAAEGAERAGGKMLRQAMGESEVPEGPSDEARRRKVGDLATMFVPIGGGEAAESRLARKAGEAVETGARALAERGRTAEAAMRAPRPQVRPRTVPTSGQQAYDRDVALLHNEGVQLTPGQVKGGEAARKESAQKSDPLYSGARREAEDKSITSFNQAVYNRALANIGVKVKPSVYPSREAVGLVENHLGSYYDAIKPGIRATFDAPTTQAVDRAIADAAVNGKDAQERLRAFIGQKITPRLKGGVLDGDGYVAVKSALASQIRGLRGGGTFAERESAAHYEDILNAIMDSAERYSDPGVREKLKAADTGWAMLTRIQEASTRRLGGQGQFSPHDLLASVRHQSPSVGGRRPAFARGDALLQDIADAGVRVIPDRVPASDTAEKGLRTTRGLAGGLVGHAMGGVPGMAVGAAADVAAPRVTNALARASLARHYAKQAASRNPGNALRNVHRAVDPRINPRIIGGAVGVGNALRSATLAQQ